MGLSRRVTRKPIVIQAKWLRGPRTPAWDTLWDRILGENRVTTEAPLALPSLNGERDPEGKGDRKPA